ncbi:MULTISPECIES: DUF6173 family protein [Acinetobacter]|uniref:DUF6173 family protein n=1 Tax=Acinetobacter corruptisaponis TaxID=3045147 RepID=A0ABY8S6E4_9GAMM|nr:DUF6173 family protein [Acinetobacter sp. KCTC 92772]WHP06338.1 DUF6173 family protein [Acinetobacter sp. KCTC 92772]
MTHNLRRIPDNGLQKALNAVQQHNAKQELQRFYHENPVAAIRKTFEDQVKEFEESLSDDYEVGAWLASFGNQILIIVEKIQFSEPNLIIFHGRDDQDNKLQLIQHATQLNLLLNAVKKTTEEPRKPIGFVHD